MTQPAPTETQEQINARYAGVSPEATADNPPPPPAPAPPPVPAVPSWATGLALGQVPGMPAPNPSSAATQPQTAAPTTTTPAQIGPPASAAGDEEQEYDPYAHAREILGRPQFRKGLGWVDHSRQVTGGLTGEDVDVAHSALDQQATEASNAIDLGQAKGISDANQMAAFQQRKADLDRQFAAQEQAFESAKAQAIQDSTTRLGTLTADAAAGKIDPDHYWSSQSTGAKVLSVLGLALGGLASGFGGHQNAALEMVNQKINADIDAQKANLANKNQAVANQRGLLGELSTQFGGLEAGATALRAAALSSAQSDLDALLAKTKDQDVLARGADLRAGLAKQVAEERSRLAELTGQRMTTAQAFDRGGWVGGTAPGPHKVANIVRVNGKSYALQTEKDAEGAREKLNAAQNLVDIYNQADKLRAQLDKTNRVTSPLEYQRIESELNTLAEKALPQWSLANGQGQVKEDEAKRYKENLFPFTVNSAWNSQETRRADEVLAQGKQDASRQLDNLLHAYGANEVVEYQAPDKSGNLEPGAMYTGAGMLESDQTAMPSGFRPVGRSPVGPGPRPDSKEDEDAGAYAEELLRRGQTAGTPRSSFKLKEPRIGRR